LPLEPVPGHDTRYHLIAYDRRGRERDEPDGPRTAVVLREAAATLPTDVFVFSHGWNGDLPAARDQYGRWVAAMLSCAEDRARLSDRAGGFRPMLIGLHWPSKAWGEEDFGFSSRGVDAPDQPPQPDHDDDIEELVDGYSAGLGYSAAIRAAVRTVVAAALEDAAPLRLPDQVRGAYEVIDAETGLGRAGVGAAPGDDREPFDPDATYQACQLAEITSFGGPSLGGLLAPLRMLTFWQMKRRARDFGQAWAAGLLDDLQRAAPDARIHLMGHSFGCIAASAALAGRLDRPPRRPVASLTLVQGAMSLWSFCSTIPSRPSRAGYFHRVVADRLVTGPTLVTTSAHDRAVGVFYPIAAGARGQIDFAPGELPRYGGIGTWGIRGLGVDIADDVLPPTGRANDLTPGRVLNLDATDVIRTGTGPSGAHSDICHPALAHTLWQAVAATPESAGR
jgi:hypothetical protein